MTDTEDRRTLLRLLGWSDALIDACESTPYGVDFDAPEMPSVAMVELSSSNLIVESRGEQAWLTSTSRTR